MKVLSTKFCSRINSGSCNTAHINLRYNLLRRKKNNYCVRRCFQAILESSKKWQEVNWFICCFSWLWLMCDQLVTIDWLIISTEKKRIDACAALSSQQCLNFDCTPYVCINWYVSITISTGWSKRCTVKLQQKHIGYVKLDTFVNYVRTVTQLVYLRSLFLFTLRDRSNESIFRG